MTGKKTKSSYPASPVFITTDRGEVLPWSSLNQFAIKAEGDGQTRVLPTDRFGSEYTEKGLIAPLYDLEVLISLLEANTFHYRCAKAKATDTAGLGFKLVSAQESGVEEGEQTEAASETEIKNFFTNNSSSRRPIQLILTDIQMDFEALAVMAFEIVREGYAPDGKPIFITHIPGHTIRPHNAGNKFMQKRGINTVWFKRWGYDKDINKATGDEHDLGSLPPEQRATEVIWDLDYSGRSDFYGMPQIIPALGAVEGMLALRDYNIDFFRTYGIPSYAIYITGDYNLGELTRYKLEDDGSGTINESYDPNAPNMTKAYFEYKIITQVKEKLSTIAQNPHSPLILAVPGTTPESRVNLEFKPLNVEVKDSSFRMYRKDMRDEIIVAHGVPPYRIGITETGALGGSTAVESSKIYRDSVINPRKERLAALITTTIIREGFGNTTLDFEFEVLDIDEDSKDKDIADFLFKSAAITPNELRTHFGSQFGIDPVTNWPELDMFYLNGQPIRQTKTDPAVVEPPVETATGDGEPDQSSSEPESLMAAIQGLKSAIIKAAGTE